MIALEAPDATDAGRDLRVAGLYAITPDLEDTDALGALVDAAIDGGARVVQYRNKSADAALRATQCDRLARICATRDCLLIVNDHLDLALATPGAGLHVGAEDLDACAGVATLRRRLGADRVLGVSCYRSMALAHEAARAGADYVAFGSVFASATKPHAPLAPLALFAEARELGVPLVAIGGIAPDRVAALVAAGADAAAVIDDLFAARDPAATRRRAIEFAAAFAASRSSTPDSVR